MTEQTKQDLAAQPAIARATIEIKRAATGKVETYEVEFRPLPEQQEQPKEAE